MQESSDWFPKSSRSKILQPGVYSATLKSITPGVGKGFEKDEPRPTLMFSFIEKTDGVVINRTVTATTGEKTQLVNLVRSMSSTNPPSLDVIRDPDKLKEFILKLVGREFLVQVEPSKDGRFNNLIACFPAPGHIHVNHPHK
jgi:hypothetical protein